MSSYNDFIWKFFREIKNDQYDWILVKSTHPYKIIQVGGDSSESWQNYIMRLYLRSINEKHTQYNITINILVETQ